MSKFFSGKVSMRSFQIGCLIGFTQKGSRYIHSAVFDGVSEGKGGLEAQFIFYRFRDNRLGVLRLPVLGVDNGSGYVDFSDINSWDELFPYKSENRPKFMYDKICEILMDGI